MFGSKNQNLIPLLLSDSTVTVDLDNLPTGMQSISVLIVKKVTK